MNRLARDVQTQSALVELVCPLKSGPGREGVTGTYNGTSNSQDDEVDNEREDLLRGREPLSLVHDHPEDGG